MNFSSRRAIALLVVLVMSFIAIPMVGATPCSGCLPPPIIVVIPTITYVAPNMETSVNFNDSNVGVVIYKVEDEDGNTQMDVFDVTNGGAHSSYLFSITPELLAPFAIEHPAENTLLASSGDVSVYILTTGEIQINAGPDREGKMHVKIFDGIPWTTVYGYTVDPE